jgi:hypothetical protein
VADAAVVATGTAVTKAEPARAFAVGAVAEPVEADAVEAGAADAVSVFASVPT